jgi:hypothetical protein
MEDFYSKIKSLFSKAALGLNSPLFAIFARDGLAVIKDYQMNTDRRLVIRTDDILESIRLFRGGDLTEKDDVAELFFVTLAVVSLNPVNVIIFSQPGLTFILRRLGFSIIDLMNGGAEEGTLVSSPSDSVWLRRGKIMPSDLTPNEPYLHLEIKDGEKFSYGNKVFQSTTYPVVVDTLREPIYDGTLIGHHVEIDADYYVYSDEEVADLVTSKVGVSWNSRGINSMRVAGVFGFGRLGVVIRSLPNWSTVSPIIIFGDDGEASEGLVPVTPNCVSVDLNPLMTSIGKRSSSYLRQTFTNEETRWIGHLNMKIHSLISDKTVVYNLKMQLGKADFSNVVTNKEPAREDGIIQHFVGSLFSTDSYSLVTPLRTCTYDQLLRMNELHSLQTSYMDVPVTIRQTLPTYASLGRKKWNPSLNVRSVKHHGQRKLLLSEIKFLSSHSGILRVDYAGAAPGDHILLLSELFPHITFHLYDILDFSIKETDHIFIHQELFSVPNDTRGAVLISDIRSAKEKVPTSAEVIYDMMLQQEWSDHYEFSSLKFRLPFDVRFFDYKLGSINLQAWSRPRSTEVRLFTYRKAPLKRYDVREHEEKMAEFQDICRIDLYGNPEVSYPQYFALLPSGSGKSTLVRKNPDRYIDGDTIYSISGLKKQGFSKQVIQDLAHLRDEGINHNNWDGLNEMHRELVSNWISKQVKTYIILVHGVDLVPFQFRDNVIFSGKISFELNRMVARQRKPTHGMLTKRNWDESDFPIFDSFDELHYALNNINLPNVMNTEYDGESCHCFDCTYERRMLSKDIIDKINHELGGVDVDIIERDSFPDNGERLALDLAKGMWPNRILSPSPRFGKKGWIYNDYLDSIMNLYDFECNASLYDGKMGFRLILVGNSFYSLTSKHRSRIKLTPELERTFYSDSKIMRTQMMLGRYVSHNFLRLSWGNEFHAMAMFSISNVINGKDAWKYLVDRGNCSFCYFNPSLIRHMVDTISEHRLSVSYKGDIVYTISSTGNKWRDYMVNPNRIMAYALSKRKTLFMYTFKDFVTLMASKDQQMIQGRYGPFDSTDPYMNSWIFYSTIPIPNYPWPDHLNTQTWWVKVPTSILRNVWRQGPNDQRDFRAVAMIIMGAEVVRDPEDGYYYGWLNGNAINVSGHFISMLIMSGEGVIDIRRYLDTVKAQLTQAVSNNKKSPSYKRLIKEGNLTEDATRKPFKVWHTYYDYISSIYAYIVMAGHLKFKIDVWAVRIAFKSLNMMESDVPTAQFIRKRLNSKVRDLFSQYK